LVSLAPLDLVVPLALLVENVVLLVLKVLEVLLALLALEVHQVLLVYVD
jgi:hypothetical protein